MDDFAGIVVFIFGALWGSFANVVIYRMPKGESVVTPRSRCPSCGKPVRWFDNVPIVSWLILRGKCRDCKSRISGRYPVVEFVMGGLFYLAYVKVGLSYTLIEYLIFIFGLVTASVIDIDHMILPDEFTLGGLAIGIIGAAINPEREFLPAIYGVLVGGGFLWAIAVIYQILRKQEGMGGGDIKLLAWIGAVLGWTSVPFVILSSSLVGSLVGLMMIVFRKSNLGTAIPFGPYLAFGAVLYLLAGREIGDWYLGIFLPSLSPAN